MKYKMIISYDGTKYGGWQVQPNTLSIQALIQDGLKTILQSSTPITASGRTDAGVHALGQVAHFISDKEFDTRSLLYSLNGILPRDIRIHEILPVADNFHARYSVKKKIYRYHIHLSPIQDPFRFLYSLHIRTPIDLDLLKASLPLFVGTHNFMAFRSAGCASKNTTKTLYRLEMHHEGDENIYLEFEGDGFLYKMIRNIVGTLLEIAQNKRPLSTIPQLFADKDRRLSGPTAPPKGLFLYQVKYS